ncbi:hypothetical protein L873DRAFT_1812523 [Choiromyces venosus 120613-1]|uniref:Uncharacterized protein n=1 Tax=Choiromyces venosus 120613-1 TaxID=1336337 RepID=A0A3N4JBY4_9PEZI|nr:hypothetical protein L873DRAFT_1812523 [Choiromyces venosus 120613-1]
MSMWCGSHYTGPGELRAIPMQGKLGSPVVSSVASGYQGYHNGSHTHAGRSPKKPLVPKTTTLLKSPKLYTAPIDPQNSSTIPTGPSTNTNLWPLLYKSQPASTMELPACIRNIGPKQILELQAENEGNLQLGTISERALEQWKDQNPNIIESDEIRYEYNFLTQNFIIKCMPTPTHDSLQIYFTQNVLCSLVERFGSSQAMSMVSVGSGTKFSGFTGDWSGSSEKLPDAYIQLPDGNFPTVVCEAGWAEAHEELMQDARLWLLHTNGQTRIVIVLSFTENNPGTRIVAVNQEVEPKVGTEGGANDEQTVLDSIDETTDLNDLAESLFNLNQQSKLRQPLVGNLKASLHVYKACEGGEDIVESFATILLPHPPADDSGPKEFGITMQDLLGNHVPEGHNPADEIMFDLADLQEFVQRSIPRTERLRATRRAKKLLKSTVGLNEQETFAQTKRRRLDPIGMWK